MQTILITGSGGFVGKNLKEYFNDKFSLLTPRSYELDCTNIKDVEKYFKSNNIDFIIHCGNVGGAREIQDKDTTIEENLLMVENLLKFKNSDTKIILFGSGAMYGKANPIKKVNENELDSKIPTDLYGESKKQIAQKIMQRKDCVCLNIFGCYGKYEKESRFPTYAIKQNIAKKPIIINQNVIFDYLYIEDLIKIIEYFLFITPKNNIINVTPTKSISLFEIAQIVNKISNFESEIIIKEPTMGNEYTGDNARLKAEMPNLNFTPYEIGLKKLYKFLATN